MNTRFLTVLTTLAFFGFSVSAFAAPPNCEDPNSTHPKCNPDSGGGGGGAELYDVVITGDISGVGDNWGADTKQVGFNFSNSAGPNGQLSNLSFFRGLFGPNGIVCFPDDTIPIGSVILEKHKRGTAKALIWFWAYTNDVNNDTQYLYHLELNGLFTTAKDWPPAESNTLKMTEWSTHLGNEGNTIKNISCLSSGDTEDDTEFEGIDIIVTVD